MNNSSAEELVDQPYKYGFITDIETEKIPKGISAGSSSNSYRRLVQIGSSAKGARNYSQCDSMLIGDQASANTFPYINCQQMHAAIEHEASTCRVSEDQLFIFKVEGSLLKKPCQ